MQSNPKRTSVASTSKTKEKPLLDEGVGVMAKDSHKNSSAAATPRVHHGTKTTAADIYSQPKKSRDKVGPGPITEINKPRITARDLATSKYKDTHSSSRTNKDTSSKISNPSKTKLAQRIIQESKPQRTSVDRKDETTKILPRKISSSHLTAKSSPKIVTEDTAKRKAVLLDTTKSSRSEKMPANVKKSATPRLAKDLPFVGLLVNSPPVQRKHSSAANSVKEKTSHLMREGKTESVKKTTYQPIENLTQPRQRGKTITLDDDEVKVLNRDSVDNNAEMMKLSRKLTAKPKAFYIDLDEDKRSHKDEKNEDDTSFSYEDDFESYESDFESYKSDADDGSSHIENSDTASDTQGNQYKLVDNEEVTESTVQLKKSLNDEDNMLDSGSFDLRESQRSASKIPLMDDIQEKGEISAEDNSKKQTSLTDEGFLEMSSSSAVSGMRTHQNDEGNERPTFIDLTRSKENRKRRIVQEMKKKRATDLLSMITLHQVSYVMFDLKPIPYESFMEIYGNINACQTSSQTYDDGLTEEIQTEEIDTDNKWTQHPIKFSSHEVYIEEDKGPKLINGFETKFSYLWNPEMEDRAVSEDYKTNPLRIFLEQKNGVGTDKTMPFKIYEKNIKKIKYNADRLSKFLAKSEKKLSRILSNGITDGDTVKQSKWPFSKGYFNLLENVENNSKLFFLHKKPVDQIIFSDTTDSLILTAHKELNCSQEELENCSYEEILLKRCLVCVWDLSVASADTSRLPIKVLVAVENVAICRFRGDVDGLVAAALTDGSIHVWDLSEAASWHSELFSTEPKPEQRVTVRSCAYAESARSLRGAGGGGACAGLQFVAGGGAATRAQLCSVRQHGVLHLWTIIQEKLTTGTPTDIGKAYWSKVKLQISLVINLTESIDCPLQETDPNPGFNLAAVKRRSTAKKQVKNGKSRPKSSVKRPQSSKSIDFDLLDDSGGVAIEKNVWTDETLPEAKTSDGWESGVVCTDLKVVCRGRLQRFLVARNCGEVLCCDRTDGHTKITRLKIACDASTVTALEPAAALPCLLAGTDSGLLVLYSLSEARRLVALDCRPAQTDGPPADFSQMAVRNIHWPRGDPCRLLALSRGGELCLWELARGDVAPAWRARAVRRADLARAGRRSRLAVLTSNGAVEIHEVDSGSRGIDQEQLFASYVALL